jgi:TonB family protein
VLQTLVVAVLFAAASNPTVRRAARQAFELYVPIDVVRDSGGGGGRRSPLPVSQGKLPKPSLRQFTPPEVVATNPNPKLTIEPSITAPPDVALPQIASDNYGDPLGKLGLPSGGPGSHGGLGSGSSTGVGSDSGTGVWGSGSAYRIGGAVSAPVLLYKVEPEYSEEARKAKYQGVVVLRVVVDSTGRVVNPQVIRSLGLGLDEKAIEAVRRWKFRPGSKDGKPVPVIAEIEVSFRLL